MKTLLVLLALTFASAQNAGSRFTRYKSWNSRMYPAWREGDPRFRNCWTGGEVTFDLKNDAPTLVGAKATFHIRLNFPPNQTALPNGQVVWTRNCTVNGKDYQEGQSVYPDQNTEQSAVFPDGTPFTLARDKNPHYVYVWKTLGKYWQVADGPSSSLTMATDNVALGSYSMELVIYHCRGKNKFIPLGYASTVFTITDQVPFTVSLSQVNDINQADSNFIQNRAIAFAVSLHDPSQYMSGADVSFTWDFGDGSGTLISRERTVTHTYLSVGTFKPQVVLMASIPNGCTAPSAVVPVDASVVVVTPAPDPAADAPAADADPAAAADDTEEAATEAEDVPAADTNLAAAEDATADATEDAAAEATDDAAAEATEDAAAETTEDAAAEATEDAAAEATEDAAAEATEDAAAEATEDAAAEATEDAAAEATEDAAAEATEVAAAEATEDAAAEATEVAAAGEVEAASVAPAGIDTAIVPAELDAAATAAPEEADGEVATAEVTAEDEAAEDLPATAASAAPVAEGEEAAVDAATAVLPEDLNAAVSAAPEVAAAGADDAAELLQPDPVADGGVLAATESTAGEEATDAEAETAVTDDNLEDTAAPAGDEEMVPTEVPAEGEEVALVVVKRQADLSADCMVYRYGSLTTSVNVIQGIESVAIEQMSNVVLMTSQLDQNAVDVTISCQGSLPSEVCTVVSDADCVTPVESMCSVATPSPDCRLVLRQFFNDSGLFCLNVSLTNDVSLAMASARVSVEVASAGSPAGTAATVLGVMVLACVVCCIALMYRRYKQYQPLGGDSDTNSSSVTSVPLLLWNLLVRQSPGESRPLLQGRMV
ncbi:premelanosome protein a isoform X2 [Nerophis ophidion]|uniref:premelanosome protein a isoform X2 n=1 Tax=Nerophis ophidion TaxID=159077 RepID=UPI002ADFB74F|nr:premelanosome protein a isoform X2 [Nerophis ophidion]